MRGTGKKERSAVRRWRVVLCEHGHEILGLTAGNLQEPNESYRELFGSSCYAS